ncbi:MAG: hypothetical protein HWQ43_10990 [Nostoc sp. JL31]|nr:hypothetical protein [Nostoc sp. JL31]
MVQIYENCCSCYLRSEVIHAPDILHQATGSRGYTGKTRLRGLKTLILH